MAIDHSILFSKNFFISFWAKVQTTDGKDKCWPWVGGVDEYGYGRIQVRGKGSWRSHRVSYLLVNGDIPDGHVVRHSCDNPRCCNPAHLTTGTQAENIADREARGRGNHEAKLANLKFWSEWRKGRDSNPRGA